MALPISFTNTQQLATRRYQELLTGIGSLLLLRYLIMRSPKPIFTLAAWFSVLGPAAAAGLAYTAAWAGPDPSAMENGTALDSKVILGVLAAVFAAGLVAGCMSLWGVRDNGALVILPPALLGIVVSAGLEVLALFLLVLAGMPGP